MVDFSTFTDLEVVALSATTLSLALSVYFYRRSKRERDPRFHVHTNHVITGTGDEFDDLRLLWKDQAIPDFSVTTVFVWNSGREAIRKEDLAGDQKFRIRLPSENKLLDTSLNFQSTATNETRTHREDETATFSFDYLNHQQGIAIQILHTGELDEKATQVAGDVKGGRPLRRWRPPQTGRNLSLLFLFLAALGLFALLGMGIWSLAGRGDVAGGGWLGGFVGLIGAAFWVDRLTKSSIGVPRPFRSRFTMDYFFEKPAE